MPQTVRLRHVYPVSPEKLWNFAIDLGALAEVSGKRVAFRGLPEGQVFTGQHIDVEVSLFGLMPWQPYAMDVLECDAEKMVLRSDEKGVGVKSWQHTLRVMPAPEGAALEDTIVIDAGAMTWAFALWARYLYGARHKPRLAALLRG